ncbi:hypothetical protein [Saccharothrix sp. HUAS TT1]|uniref:hypothetical protein n=1 Tax=unclassified Saccharothrix TaxID=2593673 RepID=UPI00345B8707
MGPVSGLSGVVGELMLHLGHEPADHPGVRAALEEAIGDVLLDTGRAVLAEHGLAVRDLPVPELHPE